MTKPQISAVSCREQTPPHLAPGPPRFLHPRCSACGGPSPSGAGTRSAEATGGLASKGPSGFGSVSDPTLGSLLGQNLLEAQNDFPTVKGKASMPEDPEQRWLESGVLTTRGRSGEQGAPCTAPASWGQEAARNPPSLCQRSLC